MPKQNVRVQIPSLVVGYPVKWLQGKKGFKNGIAD
jgi:hypothetical protein